LHENTNFAHQGKLINTENELLRLSVSTKTAAYEKNYFPGLCLSVLLLTGCSQKDNTYFEKKLTFPRILTSDQKVKLAAYVVPTQTTI